MRGLTPDASAMRACNDRHNDKATSQQASDKERQQSARKQSEQRAADESKGEETDRARISEFFC